MLKLYYKIWADAINYERIKNGGEGHWRLFTLAYMSILLSINIATLTSIVIFFTGYDLVNWLIEMLEVVFFSEVIIDSLLYLIGFLTLSLLVNYFFVFYKKKYEYILENYDFQNGKYLLIYFGLTVVAYFGFSLLNKLGNIPDMLGW